MTWNGKTSFKKINVLLNFKLFTVYIYIYIYINQESKHIFLKVQVFHCSLLYFLKKFVFVLNLFTESIL